MSFICRPVLCPGWVTGLSWDLPLTWYPVCDLFAIVGHPVSCATCSCQASMQIQLLLSKLETITHFLSPGKDFIKCEVAGWVVKHVWAILVSFGQTTLGALSCKINYCASFINVPAIKKKYCLCFPEMKLCYNVTFPINTESLCMPIDPPVVIATWTTKPLRSCCYGSPWNSWRLYLERFCGKTLFWSSLHTLTPNLLII